MTIEEIKTELMGIEEYLEKKNAIYGLGQIKNLIKQIDNSLPVDARVMQNLGGLKLIAEEREKQIKKGWTPEHDYNEHGNGQLITAALFALTLDEDYEQDWNFEGRLKREKVAHFVKQIDNNTERDYRNLLINRYKIAGAFLEAEITRLLEEERRA